MAANDKVVRGMDGIIHSGATAVANLKEWAYTETAAQADTTVNGDAATTTRTLQTTWTGSASGLFDPSDGGQDTLVVGAEVTVTFYPDGIATGDPQSVGTGVITSIGKAGSLDNVATFSCDLQGNGALVHSDQA